MAKVEVSTADQKPGADDADLLTRYSGAPIPRPPRHGHPLLRFWQSAVGKKWVMALSGIGLLGYVLAHMVGNLKLFLGKGHLNEYADWLRALGEPVFPRTVVLWALRLGLIAAFVLHIVAAAQLTRMNQRARSGYQAPRDYVAANFASRTMRWTGVIIGLFVIFHLLDLTWGRPAVQAGRPYDNVIESFQRAGRDRLHPGQPARLPSSHGAWSMFDLGWNNRFQPLAPLLPAALAVVIGVNVSMPLLVVTVVRSLESKVPAGATREVGQPQVRGEARQPGEQAEVHDHRRGERPRRRVGRGVAR
jgi:succinate dehydrogenase / fumarate reductase cytochrome b subunit